MRPTRDPVGPGQRSVWDFPRPPAIETDSRQAVLRHGETVVADTTDLVLVLETSHPPTFYLPRSAFGEFLRPTERTTFCEWKGSARYVDVVVPGAAPLLEVGWWYPDPAASGRLRALAGGGLPQLHDRVAVYVGPFDEITLGGERVVPQPGGFYGGWITADVAGPFKGGPGTHGW